MNSLGSQNWYPNGAWISTANVVGQTGWNTAQLNQGCVFLELIVLNFIILNFILNIPCSDREGANGPGNLWLAFQMGSLAPTSWTRLVPIF